MRQHKVGLLNAEMNVSGFLSNVLEGFRKEQSDDVDGHCTVKPLALMKHLVKLTVPYNDEHVVLDPFAGTGTTCLAAKELGHHFVGMEINADYVPIAESRIRQAGSGQQCLFSE
jgi:site-specific DNA-methyltransferase (adenine-specific)